MNNCHFWLEKLIFVCHILHLNITREPLDFVVWYVFFNQLGYHKGTISTINSFFLVTSNHHFLSVFGGSLWNSSISSVDSSAPWRYLLWLPGSFVVLPEAPEIQFFGLGMNHQGQGQALSVLFLCLRDAIVIPLNHGIHHVKFKRQLSCRCPTLQPSWCLVFLRQLDFMAVNVDD